MTFFGVELVMDDRVEHFLKATRQNFIFTEFFNARLKTVSRGEKTWCLFQGVTPLPAPYGWIGLGLGVIVFVMAGWTWWLLLPLAAALPEVAKWSWVWRFMFLRSLRKYGFTGSVRALKDEEMFWLVME